MNTELKTDINSFLKEVESTRELYKVMMDCISYHISDGKNCSSVFPLAEIIENKFKDLEASSDKIFLELYSK